MSALSDLENLRLHDVADRDVRDDPRWLALMGEGAVKAFLADMAAKHLPGRHPQDSHGNDNGVDVPNPLDKLKLAGRIQLGPGEKLLSSRKFRTRTDSDSWDMVAAELDTPAGRRVRLGVVAEAKNWAGGPDRERQRRISELDERIERIEAGEENVSDETYDRLVEERSDLGHNDDDKYDRTVVLDPAAIGALRTALEDGAAKGRAHQKEDNEFWDSPEGVRLSELAGERDKRLAEFARKPSFMLTDEERRRRDDIQARFDAEHGEELARLNALAPDPEEVLAEGHLPGGPEGDLYYEVAGRDDGEGGWDIRFGIKPPDADDGWYIGSIVDDEAVFEPPQIKGLLKALAELSGDQSKSFRDTQGKHLPGVRRIKRFDPHQLRGPDGRWTDGAPGVDLSASALDGIEIYSPERIEEIYGEIKDEEGVRLGDDGAYLTAKYFTSGEDMHVSWDLPDGSSQVLEEMNVESMRQLADDIERVLDEFDYADFDPADYGPNDVVVDADSDKHGFYIYADRDGDLRIDPEGGGTSASAFDISAAQAREFVAALNNMADGYEDHFEYGDPDEKSAGKSASKGASMATTTRSRSMNTKTMQANGFRIKNADRGEFSAVLATLNVIDSDGDVTRPGAFDGSDFPLSAYGHKSWEGALPVGIGRVKEVGNEAILEGHFFMDTTHGRDTFLTVKRLGPLGQWSYGYDPVGHSNGMHEGKSVRFLEKLKVHEASPVLVGAGVGTRTLGTKGRSMTTSGRSRAVKGAIPCHETKTVSRAWDRVRTEAALPDDARPSELRSVYAWVDPDGDPELKASYGWPHHHGIGGPANLRACLMGIAALNGPAGADMGDAERKGIYDHLAGHLKDADRDIPDLRTGPGDNSKSRFSDEAVMVLASVSGLIDRASDVMAMRRTKGKGMAANTAELMGWVGDEMKRLQSLLSNPVEPETPQPSEEEIHSLMVASMARIRGIAPGA